MRGRGKRPLQAAIQQAVLDRGRQPRPVGLAGRQRGGRLHHHAHLLHARPLTQLLGHLRDCGVDDVGHLRVGERGRQILVDDPCFGVLVGRELSAAVLGVDLRGLAALPGLLGQHLEHLVVGEFPRLLAGDLLGLDRGQQHPQRRGAQLVLGLHRIGQIRPQPGLEFRHG